MTTSASRPSSAAWRRRVGRAGTWSGRAGRGATRASRTERRGPGPRGRPGRRGSPSASCAAERRWRARRTAAGEQVVSGGGSACPAVAARRRRPAVGVLGRACLGERGPIAVGVVGGRQALGGEPRERGEGLALLRRQLAPAGAQLVERRGGPAKASVRRASARFIGGLRGRRLGRRRAGWEASSTTKRSGSAAASPSYVGATRAKNSPPRVRAVGLAAGDPREALLGSMRSSSVRSGVSPPVPNEFSARIASTPSARPPPW